MFRTTLTLGRFASSLCLLSFVFCLLSFVFCLLSFVFCLSSFVFCLLSFVFCLLSFVFCLLSSVFCLLSSLQQAQHAILRAIIHNNPSSLASESAWKALVLSSWLLLGRPAVNASESNCAHFLDAALWATVRAECDIAPEQDAARRTATQQKQSRVRKVATLARTGEKGRALAAARNAPPVPVTDQIVQEIKSLYPTDPEPPALAQAFVSGMFLSEAAEHIPTTHRKMPRLSEPGPLGLRAELWYDFGSLSGGEQ